MANIKGGGKPKKKADKAALEAKQVKMGRPPLVIDWAKFDNMCFIHCTLEEIAHLHSCSITTIETHVQKEKGMTFLEYWAEKSSGGKMSLRRAQFQAAMKGNVTAMIWVGKQMLGQRDKFDHEHAGPGGGPIKTEQSVDLAKFSEDELRTWLALNEKAVAPPASSPEPPNALQGAMAPLLSVVPALIEEKQN